TLETSDYVVPRAQRGVISCHALTKLLAQTTVIVLNCASTNEGYISTVDVSGVLVGGCLDFFFQAEDGIRGKLVTGVQTCALPICRVLDERRRPRAPARRARLGGLRAQPELARDRPQRGDHVRDVVVELEPEQLGAGV